MSRKRYIFKHSDLYLRDNFLSDPNSLLNHILTQLTLLEKPEIYIMGRICHQQRDVGFFSDVSKGYKYSGQFMSSQPLTPKLREIIELVNKETGSEFNSILINRYNNGNEYVGKHSDDEKGLDKGGKVVAISLGAGRKFRVRRKSDDKLLRDIITKDNQLLIMGKNFQSYYVHEIPVEKKVKDSRISLTFRRHLE